MKMYQLPHIAITINNIQDTKDFYTKLGFLVKEDTYSQEKKRHFLLLEGFGLEMEVFCFDEQLPDQYYEAHVQKVGLQHIAFPVANVEEKKIELLSKGLVLSRDVTVSSLGVKHINIIDPSGIVIEFFEQL